MNFRTEVKINNPAFQLDHRQHVFSIGSCFAQHLASHLSIDGFHVFSNPFGIVYNPMSVSEQLNAILTQKKYEENALFHHNELWHSFDHHGSFSGTNKEVVLENINRKIEQGGALISSSRLLVLTMGTAWVYTHRESNQVVANCHKVPNSAFDKRLLSVDEIVETLSSSMQAINDANSNLQILITVSPVRHLKDGFEENTLSKSILRLATQQLVEKFTNISYFPAFEMVLDELRDYRYYNSDMVHPSDQAVQYIYDRFKKNYLSVDAQNLASQVADIHRRLSHRPLFPDTSASIKFQQDTKKSAQTLLSEHPEIYLEMNSFLSE